MADKNGKAWYEDGYDEASETSKKSNNVIPTATIGPASENSKTVITKEEAKKAGIKVNSLPTRYELDHPVITGNKKTDENGWVDDQGMVHLNSRLTESRSKAAKEDKEQGRDYKTAKAPSQRELDMRNGNFTSWSNSELVNARANARTNGDTELEKKLQDEINKRYAAGTAPEFAPAKKEEPKVEKKEEPKAETVKEDNSAFQVGEDMSGEENFTGNGTSEGDKTKTRKDDYWTNFIYGNGYGSIKDNDAKTEKEKKMDQFLKNNPSLITSIFSKNSGLNFGERAVRLGEMLAMIGADATRGAYAGFNHQALPEATKGRYSEIYNNALKNQYERKQDVFESENKANIDKANRLSILKSSPVLSDALDEKTFSVLADKLVLGMSDAEWDNLRNTLNRDGKTFSDSEWNEIKNTFNSMRNTFSDITAQRGNVVDLNGKEFDLMRKPQEAINELEARKAELKKQLMEVETLKYEKLTEFMQRFRSIYSGIQNVSASMQDSKQFGYNAQASVSGGIPVVSGSASGGVNGGNSSSTASGSTTDLLALEGMKNGKEAAAKWDKDSASYRAAIKASIEEAIKEIDNQIESLQKYQGTQKVDDGIVKAPYMKQWLVREDGTKIELNPSDSIYATKNDLTTKRDNGEEKVVPMEKEDKVVVIQRKLGYKNDRPINKKTDYYLAKLK